MSMLSNYMVVDAVQGNENNTQSGQQMGPAHMIYTFVSNREFTPIYLRYILRICVHPYP